MKNAAYFLNLRFNGISRKTLFEESATLKHVITVNADFIVRAQQDLKFRELINNNYATFDGQVPLLLARKANPQIQIEKISGSDFIYDICSEAKVNNQKVFLLGGRKDSNTKSVQKLREQFNIEIEGYSPPFSPYPFSEALDQDIISKIIDFKPDYILVGFGMLKQEYWIEEHKQILSENNVKLAVGVGGTFEFISGNIKRAPKAVQNLGLEWLYRVVQEPRRLLKRYLISNSAFTWYYLKSILSNQDL